jgi:hypothetical protein
VGATLGLKNELLNDLRERSKRKMMKAPGTPQEIYDHVSMGDVENKNENDDTLLNRAQDTRCRQQ